MATTTWQEMRREFARFMGYYRLVGKDGGAWSTTTNVAASALLVSTELPDAGFDDYGQAAAGDDSLNGLYTLLLGTNNDRVIKRVAQYDASLGTITGTGAVYASESATMDFEIHRFHPTYLRDKANDARLSVFPLLHLPLTRHIATAQHQYRYDVPAALVKGPDRIYLYRGVPISHANNILANGDFEDYTSGVPDSWSATTLDTAEESSTTSPFNFVAKDGSSVRCTSQASSTGTLLQTISSPGTHSGQRITLQVWVYCVTPSVVSTQITINGTINLGGNADGGLHRGTGWELLTHFEDAPVTVTSLTLGISVLSTATDNTEFYVDSAVAVVGPQQEPETAPVELFGWTYREDMQGTTLRQEVTFQDSFPNNALLRFEGKGYLSSVAAETDTMEIGKPQNDLLFAQMAREMLHEEATFVADANREYNRERLAAASQRFNGLMVHRMKAPQPRMKIPF